MHDYNAERKRPIDNDPVKLEEVRTAYLARIEQEMTDANKGTLVSLSSSGGVIWIFTQLRDEMVRSHIIRDNHSRQPPDRLASYSYPGAWWGPSDC